MLDRRKLIASIGTLGTIALAGCSGGSSGPAAAVEQFYTAVIEGDVEKANEYIHGRTMQESDMGEGNFEIVSAEEVSKSEIVEKDLVGGIQNEQEVEEERERVKSQTEAEEVAFVAIEFESESQSSTQVFKAVKIDGDWKTYLD